MISLELAVSFMRRLVSGRVRVRVRGRDRGSGRVRVMDGAGLAVG